MDPKYHTHDNYLYRNDTNGYDDLSKYCNFGAGNRISWQLCWTLWSCISCWPWVIQRHSIRLKTLVWRKYCCLRRYRPHLDLAFLMLRDALLLLLYLAWWVKALVNKNVVTDEKGCSCERLAPPHQVNANCVAHWASFSVGQQGSILCPASNPTWHCWREVRKDGTLARLYLQQACLMRNTRVARGFEWWVNVQIITPIQMCTQSVISGMTYTSLSLLV